MSAAATVAADSPTDPAYADGLQPGDNGGFGFTPWNMNGTYTSPVQHAMNSSSPYNQLGLAWTLYNPNGRAVSPSNAPEGGTDVSRAGRGFSPLQVGDTISTVVDNPTQRHFLRGYFIHLVSGGENTTYGGTAVSRLAIGTFEYITFGAWQLHDASSATTTLFDIDTDAGVRIDVTLTSPSTYSVTIDPLRPEVHTYTQTGTLAPGGAIDWIQFEMFNTDSDFFPSAVGGVAEPTDFYVSSISIDTPSADSDADGVSDLVDNCRYTQNAGQQDAGGIGVPSPPDGIGDACQCGSVSSVGRVLPEDVAVYRQALANPVGAPLSSAALTRCVVIGADPVACGVHQVTAIRRALNVPALPPITSSAAAQVCDSALP